MDKYKMLEKLKQGKSNIDFSFFEKVIRAFGFELDRQDRTSHKIYRKIGVNEKLNIQNKKSKAKPYQIKQFVKIIEDYTL